MTNATYFRDCLQQELARRCEKNQRYSLRAFAKALNVDVAALSRILSGRLIPSPLTTRKILDRLALGPEEREAFVASLADAERSRSMAKIGGTWVASKTAAAPRPKELSLDMFRVIADWYHYAILELTFTPDFNDSPSWIAQQLGISPAAAKMAIDRLLALELLSRDKKGRLRKTDVQITTGDKHLTTPAHRRRQKEILEKALESLENDPIEKRSQTAMTMAIDPAKLPEAKKMVEEFTRKLCAFLESGKQKQVYEMSISVFPLQKEK